MRATPIPPAGTLFGLCILLVEDEMILAMMIEDMLKELGCEVVKAARVASAIQLIAGKTFDGAILDVNVAGEAIYPVAHELEIRGIPFIFSSGYGASGLSPEYAGQPTLSKPYRQEEIEPMLAGAILSHRHRIP